MRKYIFPVFFFSLAVNAAIAQKINVAPEPAWLYKTTARDYQYTGMKRAFVVLKDVRSDDRIEVSYLLIGFNPVYAGKFTSELYFTSGNAIGTYIESVLAPAGRKLGIRAINGAT